MKLTITESHLAEAIINVQKFNTYGGGALPSGSYCGSCLIAVALHRTNPEIKKVAVGMDSVSIDGEAFLLDTTGFILRNRFDQGAFNRISDCLPLTIELTPASPSDLPESMTPSTVL